jgi:NADH-quinone oxidoreductase subunit A
MDILAESYLRPYLPVGIYALVLLATGAAMLGLSQVLGPRRPSAEKITTYECGVPLLSGARQKFSVRFYRIAILFVLFDIEAVFLLPWAIHYRKLGFFAVAEMLVFLGVLVLGYVYAWRRGGLDWD